MAFYPYRREIRPSLEMSLGEHTDREYEKIERALTSIIEQMTGWGAYYHTGTSQSLATSTKVTLTNNAGTIIDDHKPSDVASFYDAGKITGREGDGIAVGIELTFTPDNATASNLYMAIDIGGTVGEIYPKDFPITKGASIPHKISYNITAFTLDTWEANGGTVKIEVDGPGVVTDVRYVIHRIHKAR